MIHEVAGDILLTRARAIAHGVAPHDRFATGLARELRERWPGMYHDFELYCRQQEPASGGLWTWTGESGTPIIHLFTTDPPVADSRRPNRASLQHLSRCLRALQHLAEERRLESLALPRLATGAGGMDWELVLPMIHQHLEYLALPVIVYTTYRPALRADEPL